MKNKMSDVRGLLVETMERLVNGDEEPLDGKELDESKRMTPEKAKEISNLGKVLIESAKTEIMYIKEMKKDGMQVEAPTDFFQSGDKKQLGE
jgi:hypothetical protein